MDDRRERFNDQTRRAIGGAAPMRFVQLVACPAGEHEEGMTPVLFGLMEDGSVWEYKWGCERLAEPRMMKDAHGNQYKNQWGEKFFWWQPLRMSADKGPESEEPPNPPL